MPAYRPRIVDGILERELATVGAVMIQGPRSCGKTATGMMLSRSRVLMDDRDDPGILMAATDDPSRILQGDVPRLIDEWQSAPGIWDAVRHEVDRRGLAGQFILAGSSAPREDWMLHTGTGRISKVMMRTMSLYESGESDGSVSLRDMFGSGTVGYHESTLDMDGVVGALVRGGWPHPVVSGQTGGGYARDYLYGVADRDISRADGVRRDGDSVLRLMRALSRNICTSASVDTLVRDVEAQGGSVSDRTAVSYMDALSRVFVIEDIEAWRPPIRSKAAVRTSPKRMLGEPSVAAAALNMDAEGLSDDRMALAPLFEALCVRDLRVYAQALGGSVLHYRDSYGLDVDCVIRLRDGRWGALEIELGDSGIDRGASDLRKLAARVDERMSPPSFLAVLTGVGSSYMRSDGVAVVPIGCLRP